MSLSRSDQARVNGAKSHGPTTPEGKARSSLNALKHGRYATNAIVLSNEDAEALEELVAQYVCRIQPTDPVEYSLTREVASIDWRLTRVFALDTRMLDREMDIQLPALATAGLSLSELTRLLDASRSIVDRSKLPPYLARREAQLINARRSILAVLKDLRKNFPSSDPAPEVVLPQPLDPESPLQNEPGTNPSCEGRPKRVSPNSENASEEALQLRAGSPEPAPNGNAAFGADSENAPELGATSPDSSPELNAGLSAIPEESLQRNSLAPCPALEQTISGSTSTTADPNSQSNEVPSIAGSESAPPNHPPAPPCYAPGKADPCGSSLESAASDSAPEELDSGSIPEGAGSVPPGENPRPDLPKAA